MGKKSNKNAISHGVYASDIVMPWEQREDFDALLQGFRLDFKPCGAIEDDIVVGIAVLSWKRRRINRMEQLAFLQSSLGADLETIDKRSVSGIRSSLKELRARDERKREKFMRAAARLSDSMTGLATYVAGKKKRPLGKLGAEVRSVMTDVEALKPTIEATAKSDAEPTVIDGGYNLDMMSQPARSKHGLML